MNKSIKRMIFYLLGGIIGAFLLVWCAALIRCEVLTNKYYNEFEYAYNQGSMIGDVEYFKVLDCDGENAEIYFVSDSAGWAVEFKRQDGKWKQTKWETVWSKSGSASGAVWPYFWQAFVTGL